MVIRYIDTVYFPSWALSYAINGVTDNLSDDEIDMIDTYMRENNVGNIEAIGSEFFWNNPEFGLAGNCYVAKLYTK